MSSYYRTLKATYHWFMSVCEDHRTNQKHLVINFQSGNHSLVEMLCNVLTFSRDFYGYCHHLPVHCNNVYLNLKLQLSPFWVLLLYICRLPLAKIMVLVTKTDRISYLASMQLAKMQQEHFDYTLYGKL